MKLSPNKVLASVSSKELILDVVAVESNEFDAVDVVDPDETGSCSPSRAGGGRCGTISAASDVEPCLEPASGWDS